MDWPTYRLGVHRGDNPITQWIRWWGILPEHNSHHDTIQEPWEGHLVSNSVARQSFSSDVGVVMLVIHLSVEEYGYTMRAKYCGMCTQPIMIFTTMKSVCLHSGVCATQLASQHRTTTLAILVWQGGCGMVGVSLQ